MASSMPPPPLPPPFRLEVHIVADEESRTMFITPRLRFFHNTTPTTTIDDFCDSVQKWYSKTYGSALMIKKCQAGNGADVGAEYQVYEMFDRSGDVIRLIEQPLPGREDSLFPESTLRPTYTRKRLLSYDNEERSSKRQKLISPDQPIRSVENDPKGSMAQVPTSSPETTPRRSSSRKSTYLPCPTTKKSCWNSQTDDLLIELGSNKDVSWTKIAKEHFPTLSVEAVRGRWRTVRDHRKDIDEELRRHKSNKFSSTPKVPTSSQQSRSSRSPVRLVKRKISTTALIPHNGTAIVGGRRSGPFAKEVTETPSKPRSKNGSLTPKSVIKNPVRMCSISREVSEAHEDLLGPPARSPTRSPARSPAAFMGPATSSNADIKSEPKSSARQSISSSPPPLPENVNAKAHTDWEDIIDGEDKEEEEENDDGEDWETETGSEVMDVDSPTPKPSQMLALRPSPVRQIDEAQDPHIPQTPSKLATPPQPQRTKIPSSQPKEFRPTATKYTTLAMLREAQAEREKVLAAAEEKEAREEEARKLKQPSPELESSSESSSSSDDDSDLEERDRKPVRVRTKPRRVISFTDIRRKILRGKK